MSMAPRPAAVFAALGDPVRLDLIAALGKGASSLHELARDRPISRQAVSKHLRVLEGAGLVRSTRTGREVLWQPRAEGLDRARAHLDRVAAEWDGALARLKAHVEGAGEG